MDASVPEYPFLIYDTHIGLPLYAKNPGTYQYRGSSIGSVIYHLSDVEFNGAVVASEDIRMDLGGGDVVLEPV